MARGISTKRLLEKKFSLFEFTGIWEEIFGQPEKGGIWIIYGDEKNGKTQFALQLAEFLSRFEETLYISAEEGTGKEFQANAERAKLDPKNKKLKFMDYTELEIVSNKLAKRQAPKIVLFDNITVYNEELRNGGLRRLWNAHPNVTMIFLAHAERKEPYTATAKLCKKLAKIIVRIEGLTAFVSGRCPGGIITVNQQTAMLYHGSKILEL
jgi:adenosyl cobinamide kinase/adenosyl cobinamide phosphate guanylyltransferase